MKRPFVDRITSIAAVLAFILIWQLIGSSSPRATFLVSTPTEVADALVVGVVRDGFLYDTGVTAAEAAVGFLLGSVVGISVAIAAWFWPTLARSIRPFVVAAGAVPLLALAPMLIIWLGVGFTMKVAIAALGAGALAFAQASEGPRHLDPELVWLFKTYGASRSQVFRNLVVPTSLAWVLASLRLNVSTALLGAFIGEFISSDRGLGHIILRASGLYDIPRVLAASSLFVAIALVVHVLLERIDNAREKLLMPLVVPRRVRRAVAEDINRNTQRAQADAVRM